MFELQEGLRVHWHWGADFDAIDDRKGRFREGDLLRELFGMVGRGMAQKEYSFGRHRQFEMTHLVAKTAMNHAFQAGQFFALPFRGRKVVEGVRHRST